MKTSAVDANGHEGVAPAVQRRVNEAVAEGCELAPCESRRTASDGCSGQLGCTGVPKPLPTFDPGRSPSDAEVVADSREHYEWFGRSPKFKHARGKGVRKRLGSNLECYLHAQAPSFIDAPTPNLSSNLSSRPQPKLHGAGLPSTPPQTRRRRRGRHKHGRPARWPGSTPSAQARPPSRARSVRAQAKLEDRRLVSGTAHGWRGQREGNRGPDDQRY